MKTKSAFTILGLFVCVTACGSKSSSGNSAASATPAAASGDTSQTTIPTSGVTGIPIVTGTPVVTGGTSSSSINTIGLRDISGAPILAGQTFFLRNIHTQVCMDLQDGDPDDGGVIQSYSCLANNPNQNWMITPNADGSYLLISAASGKCLDLTLDQIPNEGNPFQTWDCTGGSNQSFFITSSASGGYQIAPVASAFQCLTGNDLMDAETCTGANDQAFDLIASSDPDPANAVKVTSSSVTTTCTTTNGSGMAPAISPAQYASALLANPILVTSNDQCDQYCDAYNATTCAMTYNVSDSNYYCAPLSTTGLVAGSASGFAVSCTQP